MEYTPVILCDSRTTVVPQFLMKTLQKQAVINQQLFCGHKNINLGNCFKWVKIISFRALGKAETFFQVEELINKSRTCKFTEGGRIFRK